jgi:hypothetical protein
MNRPVKTLFGLMIAAILAGCYRASHYTGDGQLTDNGTGVATDRYVLNLGAIDLTQRGTKSFQLAGLPPENFVVGLEISTPDDTNVIEKKAVKATISMKLAGPNGEILFTRSAPLNVLTWSVRAGEHRVFVYGRDDPGTYFNAEPETEYTLTFNVLEPDWNQSKYTTLLIAKSGGWK